jgi:hypothetical protein
VSLVPTALSLVQTPVSWAPTPASLMPTLASLGGCELSLERCLQSLPLKPAAQILLQATPTMIWKARACLRTSIVVHRSDGRTTNDLAASMAWSHCTVASPAQLKPQLTIVQSRKRRE